MKHPITPDGRYFVVRGRLWRCSNPSLDPVARSQLTHQLMAARRAVREALRRADPHAEQAARDAVDSVKRALGERGDPWWSDGAPDYNRHMARSTPYAAWHESIAAGDAHG